MEAVRSPSGVRVSFESYGSGPPLVLVHGGFSDHDSNWEFVRPLLEPHFTVFAVARRGRGQTDATEGHALEDEAEDVAAVIRSAGSPVFLLGHSYGAQTALAAAARVPALVRKLVLYEPPWPHLMSSAVLSPLEAIVAGGDWGLFAATFFGDVLKVPAEELEALRASDLWAPIVADAKASLNDLRALSRYRFEAADFRGLDLPVLLQVGTESPRELWATDALAAVFPDARIEELAGQAHEAMTTAPDLYAASVTRFLLG